MKFPISLHPIREIELQNALKRKKTTTRVAAQNRQRALRRRIDNERRINYHEFEVVVSVRHIMQLVEEKRSCYHVGMGRIIPAAVLQNWNARQLHDLIERKGLRVYPKNNK